MPFTDAGKGPNTIVNRLGCRSSTYGVYEKGNGNLTVSKKFYDSFEKLNDQPTDNQYDHRGEAYILNFEKELDGQEIDISD